jgi:hypothetical protein
MIEIRKLITTRETVFSELGVEANRPTTRAVGMAVIRNHFAVQFIEDLSLEGFEGVIFVEVYDDNITDFARSIGEMGFRKVDEYRRYAKCSNWVLMR